MNFSKKKYNGGGVLDITLGSENGKNYIIVCVIMSGFCLLFSGLLVKKILDKIHINNKQNLTKYELNQLEKLVSTNDEIQEVMRKYQIDTTELDSIAERELEEMMLEDELEEMMLEDEFKTQQSHKGGTIPWLVCTGVTVVTAGVYACYKIFLPIANNSKVSDPNYLKQQAKEQIKDNINTLENFINNKNRELTELENNPPKNNNRDQQKNKEINDRYVRLKKQLTTEISNKTAILKNMKIMLQNIENDTASIKPYP